MRTYIQDSGEKEKFKSMLLTSLSPSISNDDLSPSISNDDLEQSLIPQSKGPFQRQRLLTNEAEILPLE